MMPPVLLALVKRQVLCSQLILPFPQRTSLLSAEKVALRLPDIAVSLSLELEAVSWRCGGVGAGWESGWVWEMRHR